MVSTPPRLCNVLGVAPAALFISMSDRLTYAEAYEEAYEPLWSVLLGAVLDLALSKLRREACR